MNPIQIFESTFEKIQRDYLHWLVIKQAGYFNLT